MIRAASSLRHVRRVTSLRSRSPGIISCTEQDRLSPDYATPLALPTIHLASSSSSLFAGQQRLFSSTSTNETNDPVTTPVDNTSSDATATFDALGKFFPDEETTAETATAVADAASSVDGALVWEPHWYNLADQAIHLVNFFQNTTGLSYGATIVGVTCLARVVLLPVFVKGQRTQSRMAHMQPELNAIKAQIDKLGTDTDREMQLKYMAQMKALFKKYDCNPASAMVLPLAQAPFFMSMFFGLRKMPDYFPEELSTGGMWWFPDLTQTDPLYILPMFSAVSFFVMIENGKKQMMASNPAQGQMMVNFFRGMCVIMVPVAMSFSTAVLCYWVTNNTITLAQNMAFQNPTVRKKLGIWDPPKPVPGTEPKSLTETIKEVAGKIQGKAVSDEDKMKRHNEKIENKKKARQFSKEARAKRNERFSNVKR